MCCTARPPLPKASKVSIIFKFETTIIPVPLLVHGGRCALSFRSRIISSKIMGDQERGRRRPLDSGGELLDSGPGPVS